MMHTEKFMKQTKSFDQTGGFPFQSARRHKYLMVMYEIDGIYNDVEPLKSQKENEMIQA